MKIRSCVSVVGVLACASVVCAQGSGGVHNNQHLRFTQEHGYTFSTIGDVGNPSYNFRGPFNINYSIGAVDYEYRIATTETTVAQYFEFVGTVAPHIQALGGKVGTLPGFNTLG